MPIETADTIVIGAGVIGLAVARQLAQTGREVVVLESNDTFGMETSSRNSGVIHAGIYYPPDSLKAQSCVRGKQLLYDYCVKRHIPHERISKLIIAANEDQHRHLRALQKNAFESGVKNIQWLDQARVGDLEPDVEASAALLSPSTGIVDVHELMLAFLGDLEAAGGTLVTHSRVLGGRSKNNAIELNVDNGGEFRLLANTVINASGHGAAKIARSITGFPREHIPTIYPIRGHYYEHHGKLPFSRLIYPVPESKGLGIHVTLDLAGQGRFGPDAEYCDAIDYRFDESRKPRFARAIRKWYPGLDESRLQPGYVGVRPNLKAPDEVFRDFVISGPSEHGVNGLVNLFGMDSPGLTACMALAEEVTLKI